MNERDISLLKAVSEVVKEQLAALKKVMKQPWRGRQLKLNR